MIKPNEIRYGNWFNLKSGGRTYIAHWKDLQDLSKYEPIPLTPRILEACGFHKDNYGLYEKVKDDAPYISGCEIILWTRKYKTEWEFCVGNSLDNLHEVAKCKYLHQLQNLYFSMTSKELNVEVSDTTKMPS